MLKSYEAFIYDVNKAYSYTLRPDKEEKITPPGVDPTKLFFLRFFFFGVKLGHFDINKFFSVCNKNASLPAKNGEILC